MMAFLLRSWIPLKSCLDKKKDQGPFSKIARQLQYKRDTYDQDRVSHKNMKVYDDTDAM